MQDSVSQNNTTLEDLAAMVARGFEDVASRMATKDDIANMATKDDIARLDVKIDLLGQRIDNLESRMLSEISSLRSEIAKYSALTDARYQELKHRQEVIVAWLLKLAEKNQIELNMEDLEYKS